MRRKNLGSRIVKKAITWAMIVMMSFSGAMSGFASMTVYAEESGTPAETELKPETETTVDDNKDESGHEVTTEINQREEVYSDSDDEPVSKDAVEEVKESQTLDYTEVVTTVDVDSVETHYNIVTTDESGNTEVIAEVDADAEVSEVTVIEKNDGTKEEVIDQDTVRVGYFDEETGTFIEGTEDDGVSREYVLTENGEYKEITTENKMEFYVGYFDEETGAFIEGTEGDGKSQRYVLTEEGEYKETTTVNKVTQVNGEDAYIEDGVVEAIEKGKSDDGEYTRKTIYIVEGSTLTEDNVTNGALNGSDYWIDPETGILTIEAQEETREFNYVDGIGEISDSAEVDIKPIQNQRPGHGGQQEHKYKVTIDGAEYIVSSGAVEKNTSVTYYVWKWDGSLKKVVVDKETYDRTWYKAEIKEETTYSLKSETRQETTYSITVNGNKQTVDPQNLSTETHYQVKDNEENTIVEVDAETKGNIESKNYTKVNDSYVVKDKDGNDVYFSQSDWNLITSHNVVYEEVTKLYYTTESKYVDTATDITIDDKDYQLKLKFWNGAKVVQNGDVILTETTAEDGSKAVLVTVPYKYVSGVDAEGNDVWTEDVYKTTIKLKDFGVSRIATLSVKYTPTLTSTQKVSFEKEETTVKTELTKEEKEELEALKLAAETPIQKVVEVDGTVEANVPNTWMAWKKANNDSWNNTGYAVDEEGRAVGLVVSKEEYEKGTNLELKKGIWGKYYYVDANVSEYTSSDGIKYKVMYAVSPVDGKPYPYLCIAVGTKLPAGSKVEVYYEKNQEAIDAYNARKEELENRTTTVTVENTDPTITTTTGTELGEVTDKQNQEIITAGIFVRSDEIQQKEDGSTHYSSSDYSKDLSGLYSEILKQGKFDLDKIYLAYTKSGLLVNDANLAELSGKTDEEIAALSRSEKNELIMELINARLSEGNSEDNDLALLAKKYIDEVKTDELKQAALEEVARKLGVVIDETEGKPTYTTAAGNTYEDLETAIKAQTEYLAKKASKEAEAALDSAVADAMNSLEDLEISKEQFIIKSEDGTEITADTIDELKKTILDIAEANQKPAYTYQYDGKKVEAASEEALKKLVMENVLDSATEEYVIHYTFADGEPKTYSAGNANEAVSALLKDVEANAQVDGSGRARLQLVGGAYTEYFASIDALKAYVESVAKDTTKAITVYHFDGNDYENLDAIKAELEKKFKPVETVKYVFNEVEKDNLEDLWDTIKSSLDKKEVKGYEFGGEFYAKSDVNALEAAIRKELTARLNEANKDLTEDITFIVDGSDYDDIEEAIAAYRKILVDSQNIEWYVLKTESDGYHIDGVYSVNNNVVFGHNASVFNDFDTALELLGSRKTNLNLSLVAVQQHIVNQSKLDSYTTSYQWGFELAPASPTPTPVTPTPVTPTPEPTTPGGGTTPTDTPVIIPDEPVALAAAPVAADNGAAVLGARRTDGDAAEAAVLGARRGTEQAVLGKRRKPQTGDTAALNAWMAAMTMAAGAAGISGTKLAKGKKKEEKED